MNQIIVVVISLHTLKVLYIQKFYTQKKKKNHFKLAIRNSLWKEKDLEFKGFILKKKKNHFKSAVRNSLWKEKNLEFKGLINESNNNNCCCNFFTYIETLKYKSFILKKKKKSFQAIRNSLWKEKDLEFKGLINESNNNNCWIYIEKVASCYLPLRRFIRCPINAILVPLDVEFNRFYVRFSFSTPLLSRVEK